MLNYTIGAVKKKKSTAKKKLTTGRRGVEELFGKKGAGFEYGSPKGRKPTKGSRVSANGERYFPSTSPKKKSYKPSATCVAAGKGTKAGSSKAAGILALCRASVKNLKTTAAALKEYGVTKGKLSRKK